MEMPPGAHSTRARGKGAPFDKDFFTVVFYGPKILRRKTAQLYVTRRNSEMAECLASATMRKPVKTRAKTLS
jgi:hypothetical protein